MVASQMGPRSALEKFCAMQMIDVHIPTAYGRELILGRYTQSEAELGRLRIVLPPQLPPKITAAQAAIATRV